MGPSWAIELALVELNQVQELIRRRDQKEYAALCSPSMLRPCTSRSRSRSRRAPLTLRMLLPLYCCANPNPNPNPKLLPSPIPTTSPIPKFYHSLLFKYSNNTNINLSSSYTQTMTAISRCFFSGHYDTQDSQSLVVVSFYKFADFPDHANMRKPLKDLCHQLVLTFRTLSLSL